MSNADRLAHRPNDPRVFKIGDWVLVSDTVEMGYFNQQCIKRTARRCPGFISGQIVGVSIRYEGTRDAGRYEDGEQATLRPTKRLVLWEIRQGYLNKPVLAFAEDIKPAIGVIHGSVPWSYSRQPEWTVGDRAMMRGVAAETSRDKRGRFLKWNGHG